MDKEINEIQSESSFSSEEKRGADSSSISDGFSSYSADAELSSAGPQLPSAFLETNNNPRANNLNLEGGASSVTRAEGDQTSSLRQSVREKRLSALSETSRRADALLMRNQSLYQELEAQRISPQLTTMMGQSMRNLNAALQSLGLASDDGFDNESTSSRQSSSLWYSSRRDSVSSEVTNTTALRMQINAVDELRLLSANSTHFPLPPGARDSTSATSRSLSPERLLQVEAAVDEDEAPDEGNSDDGAISFGSSSSNTNGATEKSATPPVVSKLDSDDHISGSLLGAIICILTTFAILYGGLSSNSPKSLPSASIHAATGGKSIRNRTPEPPVARTHVSNDTLSQAFEALVGDGIHTTGSTQYLATWWILEKDPRRHRSTLGRLKQRFLLACFYFKTSDNCKRPWLSCNYEQTSPLPSSRAASRHTFIDHADHSTCHEDVSRTATSISGRSSTSRSIQSSSCEFKQPLHDEQGEITGYETTESYRWLSGHSECSWAGISCKYNDDSLAVNPVVEINLEGQIHFESIVTEILQLPSLESLYY